MNLNKLIYAIILTNLHLSLFSQKSPNTNFLFPINIEPSVSGSFGELRTNHFHAGIDLSTKGKIGLPIISMDEGTVSRIKVSPVGYGNAVYIKHPNGYTTVYGHLRNYSAKIDSVITAEQYKIKSFAIDYFPDREIKIARGEVIGYSGNTGSSGGPHLHYEIRDTESEEPINPFFFQDKIKDNVRPKILTVRIYPLDKNSRVNGSPTPKSYPVVFYDGQYHLKSKPKIYANGNIGIGLEMLDYMSGSWKKCGVYKLNMTVDEQDYYNWELDRFSFYESRYINSHIDFAYKTKYGKRFERCFRQPGNKLSIYGNMKNNGVIDMDSSKTIFIRAFDAANNVAELKFTLLKGKDTSGVSGNKVLTAYNEDNILKYNNVNCQIPLGALYSDSNIELKTENDLNNGVIYKIGNRAIPLHKYIRIAIKIPDSLKHMEEYLCLATLNGSQRKIYAGGKVQNDSIVLTTRSFGDYTFAVDSIAPNIRALQNIRGRVFNTQSKFFFKISDNFSGIKSYDIYLNGEWTLCEYDAKSDQLTCPLSKAPIKKGGNYDFKLVVKDNCGNEKVLTSHFMVS